MTSEDVQKAITMIDQFGHEITGIRNLITTNRLLSSPKDIIEKAELLFQCIETFNRLKESIKPSEIKETFGNINTLPIHDPINESSNHSDNSSDSSDSSVYFGVQDDEKDETIVVNKAPIDIKKFIETFDDIDVYVNEPQSDDESVDNVIKNSLAKYNETINSKCVVPEEKINEEKMKGINIIERNELTKLSSNTKITDDVLHLI